MLVHSAHDDTSKGITDMMDPHRTECILEKQRTFWKKTCATYIKSLVISVQAHIAITTVVGA